MGLIFPRRRLFIPAAPFVVRPRRGLPDARRRIIPATMAVAVDATPAVTLDKIFAAVTTVDFTTLTTVAATSIYVGLCFSTPPTTFPSAITVVWDPAGVNQSFTQVPSTLIQVSSGNSDETVIFALDNPSAQGNKVIRASWTTTCDGYITAMSFKGSDTAGSAVNGITASGTSTTPTISVNSPAGNFTFGCIISDSATFSSTNQTQLFIDNGGAAGNGAANYTTGGGASTTLSANLGASGAWNYSACSVKAATAAGASASTLPLMGVG
jgi:hypothetical protein